MKRIDTNTDLINFRNILKKEKEMCESKKVIIKVAMSTCSIATGSDLVIKSFEEKMKLQAFEFKIIQTGCTGLCHSEPTVEIRLPGKDPIMFGNVDKEMINTIIEDYIKDSKVVKGIIDYYI